MSSKKKSELPKLVRDRIPELIRAKGLDEQHHRARPNEMHALLLRKLSEEVDEFLESDSAEELADVIEVIEAIKARRGVDWSSQVIREGDRKRRERGGFDDRIVLDEWEDD